MGQNVFDFTRLPKKLLTECLESESRLSNIKFLYDCESAEFIEVVHVPVDATKKVQIIHKLLRMDC